MKDIRLALSAAAAALGLLLNPGTATAQKINKEVEIMNYFGCHKGLYIYADGGLTSQEMKSTMALHDGYTEKHWGGQFKSGVQWFYRPHLGIGAGVIYSRMNVDSIPISGYRQDVTDAIDEMGRPYEHHTYFRNMSEKVSITSLSVPVMLYYQTNLSISWKAFLAGGAMMTFYPSSKFSTRDSLSTASYWPEWDLEYDGGGHNTYTMGGFEGKYQFNPNLSVIGEAGLLYAITPRLDAYLSVMGQYRLTPMPEKTGGLIYDPDCREADAYTNLSYCGIMSSDASPKVASLSLGFQIGVRYRLTGETKFNMEEYQRQRREHQMMDADFDRNRRIDFDRMEREKRQRQQDSTELDLKRREREMKDAEFERQRRKQDSLQQLLAADTAKKVDADTKPVVDPKVMTPELEAELNQLIMDINDNYCAFNEYGMEGNRKQKSGIQRLAEIMKDHPDVKIAVIGHTCDIGTMEQNKLVGLRRAQKFRDVLVEQGVDASQITCDTKWWTEPLVPNTSEKNRAKNRRVQVKRK